MKDLKYRKFHEEGHYTMTSEALEEIDLAYHFFNSGHNSFIFFIPQGERNASRTKIYFNSKE
jgi:hypothetical protein